MKILLVCMPWATLDTPSLALSNLTGALVESGKGHRIDTRYANLDWFDYVIRNLPDFDFDEYQSISEGYFYATGDWIFSGSLYGDTDPAATEFYELAVQERTDLTLPAKLFSLADGFIQELADEIIEQDYGAVGVTSTFLQNTAALSLAKALKQRRKKIVTLMGGANCDGPQGAALHRNFDFLDLVFRGEAEKAFPEAIEIIATNSPTSNGLSRIPGLCWRGEDGTLHANAQRMQPVGMDALPYPDHTAYFQALKKSPLARVLEPRLVHEGSRGCWWGEKHHCTFCGLNGSTMQFRNKSTERLLKEIVSSSDTHRVLDVMLVDNILAFDHLRELMPRLAAEDIDLRIFCEIKSNLRDEELGKLAAGGVVAVQPGIENLNSRVLEIMDKGVTAAQNVAMLRDAKRHSLTVMWNYLYGFPGEDFEAHYRPVIARMDHLVHLQPPGAAFRVGVERYSPYFNDPSLGLPAVQPAKHFASIYKLPLSEIRDLVYLFDTEEQGLTIDDVQILNRKIDKWQELFPNSSLDMYQQENELTIVDARNQTESVHVLRGLEMNLLLAMGRPRSTRSLARELETPVETIEQILSGWCERGWTFQDGEHFVGLPVGEYRPRRGQQKAPGAGPRLLPILAGEAR